MSKQSGLEQYRAPTGIRLALLWTSLMFLFVYNDYISMYSPGVVADMMAGRMGPLGAATDPTLIGVAILMSIPALMIVASATLPPRVSKWSNLLFGAVYTVINALTLIGSRPFYQMIVAFEIVLTLLIVWTAWRWPKTAA